jgi:benzodiazapine receptor
MTTIKKQDIARLIISIVICQSVGVIGAFFTQPAIPTWYATLVKPAFTPPHWVFAPAWTTLYVLMGIALFLVWRRGLAEGKVKLAIGLFSVQLLCNAVWSPLFFGLRSPLAGLVDIVVLWIAIACTIFSFLKISRTSGIVLVPYLMWVSFAAVLNAAIWRLNP